MKKIFRWAEGWDGGEASIDFEKAEDAIKEMHKHLEEIRLTKRELQELIKKAENYLIVNSYDEDGEIIDDCIDSIEVTEDTIFLY